MPNKNLHQQAEAAIRQAEKRARNFYAIDLPVAAIDFSLRGRCAGQASVDRNGETCLRINLQPATISGESRRLSKQDHPSRSCSSGCQLASPKKSPATAATRQGMAGCDAAMLWP